MEKKNLVIVGGGTAGWLTALKLQKLYHNKYNITVIENTDIGILGAGEGSTPSLVDFLYSVDISTQEFLEHSEGTIKLGIKFTNWNNDNESYFHPFATKNKFEPLEQPNNLRKLDLLKLQYAKTGAISNCIIQNLLSNKKQIPLNKDNFNNSSFYGSYSCHFNAAKTAEFFKKKATERGVILKNLLVQDIVQDQDGYITHLKVKDHDDIAVDFIVDSTGFRRLIIGKLGGIWKSYRDLLPVNRAMPFFIDNNDFDVIEPCTYAIAMKFGWIWKIPVKGRYGCGYVYDNNLISDDDAKIEIENYLGREIIPPRMFKFEAGCYENSWIKNCVTTGLATGFIEPLEATSIWSTIIALDCFTSVFDHNHGRNTKTVELYNKRVYDMNVSIRDFIFLHYCSNRTDTEFWTSFINNTKKPANIEFILDPKNTKMIPMIGDNFFNTNSFFYVGTGINCGMYSRSSIEKDLKETYTDEQLHNMQLEILRFKEKINYEIPKSIAHGDFLRFVWKTN